MRMDFLDRRRQHRRSSRLAVNQMRRSVPLVILFSLLVVPSSPGTQAAAMPAAAPLAPRQRLLLDFGWRFHLGNEWGSGQNLAKAGSGVGPASVVFSDASWRRVDLPHDWAVELPFDPRGDAAHGFKAMGSAFPGNNVAWYRRTFTL